MDILVGALIWLACRKMLDAFYKSAALEWHFWNDSYNQVVFDTFI